MGIGTDDWLDDIFHENARANTLSSIRIQAEQHGLLLENEIGEGLNMVFPTPGKFQLQSSLDGRAFRLNDPIAVKHRHHTFQGFYTGDSARVSRRNWQRSSGPGLAITKGVVEALGGGIWVQSAPTAIHFTMLEAAQ